MVCSLLYMCEVKNLNLKLLSKVGRCDSEALYSSNLVSLDE